jgi:glycosyltransferase involved in cell wall biosynthesis
VLVHPSHFENLSMAIIESMSYGLACVANDVGGNSELVGSESGWLLPLGDVSAWQHALTEACSVSLASKRRTARDRWEKHFTVERQAEVMRTELAALSHVG